MSYRFDNEQLDNIVKIKVIGVGGAGNNAVNRMIASGVRGVDFISVNSDMQALASSDAPIKLQIGSKLTKGQGCGSDPDKGKRAAEESRDAIVDLLKNTDMVFITAGMGGGTGTGAAPIISACAKEMGILTVAIVTKPFGFEGRHKMKKAEAGIEQLRDCVDSIVIIPNERLKYVSDEKLTMKNAFFIADDALKQGVESISELINTIGIINLDFADISCVMKDAGYAHMGIGRAGGKDKAKEAAQKAISSPLLETSINGAKGVIINITASEDVTLEEMEIASKMITDAANPDANIIWGANLNPEMNDEIKVSVIATGFDGTAIKDNGLEKRFPEYTKTDENDQSIIDENNKDKDIFIDILSKLNKKD